MWRSCQCIVVLIGCGSSQTVRARQRTTRPIPIARAIFPSLKLKRLLRQCVRIRNHANFGVFGHGDFRIGKLYFLCWNFGACFDFEIGICYSVRSSSIDIISWVSSTNLIHYHLLLRGKIHIVSYSSTHLWKPPTKFHHIPSPWFWLPIITTTLPYTVFYTLFISPQWAERYFLRETLYEHVRVMIFSVTAEEEEHEPVLPSSGDGSSKCNRSVNGTVIMQASSAHH